MNNDDHDAQLIKRYEELSDRSEQSGIYVYSDFHSPSGASLAYRVGSANRIKLWGGADYCERTMVRFGNPEETGYDEPFPISVIHIEPKQPKYADDLTHRDFLGAIMNLGIERDVIGDILVNDRSAYVFACERIAGFICDELTQVRHTPVKCSVTESVPEAFAPKLTSETVTVSSVRLDGIISKVFHLSRSDAKARFGSEEVYVGGKACLHPEYEPDEGDIISVRGSGKFIYDGVSHKTSKERFAVSIRRYV